MTPCTDDTNAVQHSISVSPAMVRQRPDAKTIEDKSAGSSAKSSEQQRVNVLASQLQALFWERSSYGNVRVKAELTDVLCL